MKKTWFLGVAGLVLGLGFLAQSSQAAYTPVTGDTIKTASHSAVYYIGADKRRHLYVNAVTFWTWYSGTWENIKENGVTKTIKVVGQEDFDNLDLGSNVTAKPGMKLIKFTSSPRIYTVVSEAKLALVPDDATAKLLFGDDWSNDVITIQAGFEINYAKDGVFNIMTGDLIKTNSIWYFTAHKYNSESDSWSEEGPFTLNFTKDSMCQSTSIKLIECANFTLLDQYDNSIAIEGSKNGNEITVSKLTIIQ